ncbi:alpha/beta-hydrolase [Westerdykella ornata]|uniref:Alpha/beta-hydrolase n=1 Tax=Westerdykella ornata TaxID=318751 RepID=A0A6A6JRZ8_WESOR|nr:alpha/beta-hydrolase [Westerdykella ornata]KAF2279035.1 alpha/beta-hydrolase [Westerdykella ornata]
MGLQPDPHPPVPALPADPPPPLPPRGLRSRRRSSLPSVPTTLPTDSHSKKRSPNYVRAQSTSPEVISSLIESLSAISQSTHSHFENLPFASASTPASPNLQTHFGDSLTVPNGHGMDQLAHYQSLVPNPYPFLDDACEPPVIRTSKPPSGLSPITAPKKKDKEHSLKSYMSKGGGSSASVHSAHSVRSVSSFGAISIEPGIPRKISNGSNRTSSDSKRSTRAHKSLMYMSSREHLRVKEERKRATIQGPEVLKSQDPPRKPTPHLVVSEDTIKEEPIVAESSRAPQSRTSSASSPLRTTFTQLKAGDVDDPADKGLIPERGSSLKHTSPSRKSRKNHGRKNSRHDSYRTSTVIEVDETVEQDVVPKEKILKDLEAEEGEVARRIRELRKQKLLRDKIAGKLPVDVDAGASPSGWGVSPITSAEPSPTSTVSSTSERRPQAQDPAKAHRVLGITLAPSPLPAPNGRPSQGPETRQVSLNVEAVQKPQPQPKAVHARSRSLTVNDGDELTPLPIDYRLALETLERSAQSSSPTPPPGPSKGAIPSSTSPVRPRSVAAAAALGERSAEGRRTTRSMVLSKPTAHKRSPSVTSGAHDENSTRAVSEDLASRHLSLKMTSSSTASGAPQRKPTLKKNRWSHPDLPAKAQRAHNDRVEKKMNSNNAVQPPNHPVMEERPASIDSVDMDVERYLNSPRLSQRIRHPQTGRIISFSEVGDPHGFAVFVCVGMGLTRYVMAFYDQLAMTLKLRLITPDRPGVGGSQPDPNGTPLSWPDDVLIICQALKITKFSLLAHSAGAIYALATSLRMPQHIRGRVHLLAPWIPPSQMAPIGVSQDQPPQQQLPRSQRFLRTLPPSLLKIANSTFLSATSASLQRTGPKNSPKTRRKTMNTQMLAQSRPPIKETRRESIMLMDQILPNASSLSLAAKNPNDSDHEEARRMKDALSEAERERQQEFDERLTFAIWDRATTNANPATDLIVCLETKQTIGFRYEDISRAVVIHHGSKDSRVPVDNVRWLGRLMRRCEVRILDGEQHGLMASAQVMGNVLTEMASDWEDWNAAISKTTNRDRSASRRRTADKLRT